MIASRRCPMRDIERARWYADGTPPPAGRLCEAVVVLGACAVMAVVVLWPGPHWLARAATIGLIVGVLGLGAWLRAMVRR